MQMASWRALLAAALLLAGCEGGGSLTEYHARLDDDLQATWQAPPQDSLAVDGRLKLVGPQGKLRRTVHYKQGRPWAAGTALDAQGDSLNPGTLKDGTGTLWAYTLQGQPAATYHYHQGYLQRVEPQGPTARHLLLAGAPLMARPQPADLLASDTLGDPSLQDVPQMEGGAAPSPGGSSPSGFNKQAANALLAAIQQGQYGKLHQQAHPVLRQQQTVQDLHEIYGPLQQYSLENYQVMGSQQGEGMQAMYACKFRLTQASLVLSMMQQGNRYRWAGLTIQTPNYTPILQIRELVKPTVEKLMAGNYGQVYDGASSAFRQSVTKDKFTQTMQQISTLGGIAGWELYQHQVSLLEGNIAVIAVVELDISVYIKATPLTKIYTRRNGQWLLESLTG
mgnify:CR=1 FL=1